MRIGMTTGVGALLLAALPVLAQEAPSGGYGAFGDIAVRDIVGRSVLGATGESLGEVETLVSLDGDVLAVLGVGGFLGFGEHEVAVPLADLNPGEGALILPGLDRAALEAMPEHDGTGDALAMDVTVAGEPVAEPDPVAPETTPAPVE